MGREVYHGDPNGDLSERKAYDNGVREGAFGLLLNSVRTRDQFVLLAFFVFVYLTEVCNCNIYFICVGCPWRWFLPC